MFPALIMITTLSVGKDGIADCFYNTMKFDALREIFNGIKKIIDQSKEYFETKDDFLLELQKIKNKHSFKNKNENMKDRNEKKMKDNNENENEQDIESDLDNNSDQNASDSDTEMSDNESIKSTHSKISKISKISKKSKNYK